MTTTVAAQLIIRALLQAIAGYLVARGYVKSDVINVDELSGAVLFIGTVAWSWYSKHQLIKQTTNPPTNA